ncbi:MAG TPA: hypothetical protein VFU09_01640 [Candidatus Udaeobacter sp.]|nr:hypothetical protein [Candidatus Udaeobacter sp.]
MKSWPWAARLSARIAVVSLPTSAPAIRPVLATSLQARRRSWTPTTLDRILGTHFGVKAVQLANEGHLGFDGQLPNYRVRQLPIAEAVNRLKLVPPNGEVVQTARDVNISFGD